MSAAPELPDGWTVVQAHVGRMSDHAVTLELRRRSGLHGNFSDNLNDMAGAERQACRNSAVAALYPEILRCFLVDWNHREDWRAICAEAADRAKALLITLMLTE